MSCFYCDGAGYRLQWTRRGVGTGTHPSTILWAEHSDVEGLIEKEEEVMDDPSRKYAAYADPQHAIESLNEKEGE